MVSSSINVDIPRLALASVLQEEDLEKATSRTTPAEHGVTYLSASAMDVFEICMSEGEQGKQSIQHTRVDSFEERQSTEAASLPTAFHSAGSQQQEQLRVDSTLSRSGAQRGIDVVRRLSDHRKTGSSLHDSTTSNPGDTSTSSTDHGQVPATSRRTTLCSSRRCDTLGETYGADGAVGFTNTSYPDGTMRRDVQLPAFRTVAAGLEAWQAAQMEEVSGVTHRLRLMRQQIQARNAVTQSYLNVR